MGDVKGVFFLLPNTGLDIGGKKRARKQGLFFFLLCSEVKKMAKPDIGNSRIGKL